MLIAYKHGVWLFDLEQNKLNNKRKRKNQIQREEKNLSRKPLARPIRYEYAFVFALRIIEIDWNADANRGEFITCQIDHTIVIPSELSFKE